MRRSCADGLERVSITDAEGNAKKDVILPLGQVCPRLNSLGSAEIEIHW
jgi:hypothetical protein